MNQRKAKLFRRMFPTHRRAYRSFKKAYTESPIDKKIEASRLALKIKRSKKVVRNLVIPEATSGRN